jgi:hypothetical protein
VNVLDVLSKVVVPLAAPILAALGALLFNGFTRRQRQMQIVELATKRIIFWETYLKASRPILDSDPKERMKVEQEVFSAVQSVRVQTGEELRRLSWFQIVAQKRVAAVPLKGGKKALWFLWVSLTWISAATSIMYLVHVIRKSNHLGRDFNFEETATVEVVMLAFFGLVLFFRVKATDVKYPKPRPVLDDV